MIMIIPRQLAVVLMSFTAVVIVIIATAALSASFADAANIDAKISLARRAPTILDEMWKKMQSVACRLHRFGSTAGYAYNRLWISSSSSAGSPYDVANAYVDLMRFAKQETTITAPHPTIAMEAAQKTKVDSLATLSLMYRYAFYSAVTYCNDGDVAKQLTSAMLGESRMPLPLMNAQITHWYDEKSMGHYVAVSPDQKAVILSFRGSNNNRNFMDAADVSEGQPEPNLYGVPVNNIDQLPPMPNRARLFNGFARSARSQIETAVEKLYDAYSKNPTYSVIITGHSLGGAVSQLAALYARIRYRKTMPLAAVYTYGKPIIGNALFEDWSVSIIHPTPFFRFVSSDDVVPLLWYDNNSRKTPESRVRHALGAQEVYCPDFSSPTMIVCKGELDSECSEMQDCTRLSWAHHSEYAGFRATKSVCLLAQFRKK